MKQKFVIRGRVQGVFFRASMLGEAERLKLRGWVRNSPDGSVEACVQGEAAELDAMAAWCARGPQFARVDSVAREDTVAEPDCKTFEIRG